MPQFEFSVIHEGISAEVKRADSSEFEETKMQESITEIGFSREEVESVSADLVASKIRDLATQLAASQSKHTFEALDAITKQTGNVVNAKGAPLNPDIVYEMLSKVQQDYDPTTGAPNMSS